MGISVPTRHVEAAWPTLDLVKLDSAVSEGATCNDGTAPGYYVTPGTTGVALVFFQGGFHCWDDSSCVARFKAAPGLMSSNSKRGCPESSFHRHSPFLLFRFVLFCFVLFRFVPLLTHRFRFLFVSHGGNGFKFKLCPWAVNWKTPLHMLGVEIWIGCWLPRLACCCCSQRCRSI